MTSIDEQFSEANRQDVLDRVSGCVLAAVIQDISENPAGMPADEYLRATRQLIEAAKRFDERHARMRLLAARNGEVVADVSYVHALDDINLEDLTLESLRGNLAMVSQDVVLFNDTVAANIAYGSRRDAGRDDILRAAEAAHAMAFINEKIGRAHV